MLNPDKAAAKENFFFQVGRGSSLFADSFYLLVRRYKCIQRTERGQGRKKRVQKEDSTTQWSTTLPDRQTDLSSITTGKKGRMLMMNHILISATNSTLFFEFSFLLFLFPALHIKLIFS